MMLDQARLVGAGWRQTLSGRWWHEDLPGAHGRRRLFTALDALALLDASDALDSIEEGAPGAA